jgi:hypothetical protein
MRKKKARGESLPKLHEKIEVLGGDIESIIKAKKLGVYSKHLFFEMAYFFCYFIYLALAFFMLIIWEPEERSLIVKGVFSLFTIILSIGTFVFQQNMDIDIDEDIKAPHFKEPKSIKKRKTA